MADRTKFEDLSDDLIYMVLQKLSGWDRTRRSNQGLASFASVSSRCSRLVKERSSGLWEGVCRKAFPVMCMHMAPLGGSPGDAGWASFAKLLAWCPGPREFPVTEKAGNASEGHLDTTNLSTKQVPNEEFFSDASKCRAAFVLRCAHAEFHARELVYKMGDDRDNFSVTTSWIYRGFIGDLQAWAADSGINLFGLDEG
jgi:hypothetical protein